MTSDVPSRVTLGGRVETPRYRVVGEQQGFEIREYEPMVLAETEVAGTVETSGTAGFRRLGGYIFGRNARQQEISMTAPVAQQPAGNGRWRVTFMMPSAYKVEDLPMPADSTVRLVQRPRGRMAAVTFRGSWSEADVTERAEALERAATAAGYAVDGPPVFARFDPPWTPPFLRRNEVLLPLKG